MSKSIKFPAEHYLGMIVRSQKDDKDFLPLAFMTPEGQDQAAMKRKGTVDNWVSNNSRGSEYDPVTKRHVQISLKQPKPAVVKNEPMAGFRLLDEIRRHGYGWGTGNVKWRVEDPRGFELEITSPNLMQILACTVLDKGEILDMCMWAREGGDNVLVPVSSEVYTEAMENTKRVAKTASLRDLNMGDYVVMQNGNVGRYYGKMNAVEHDYSSEHPRDAAHPLHLKLTPRHIFIDDESKTTHCVSSPKLSEITKGEPITKDEAEKRMAKLFKSSGWTTNCPGYYTHAFTFSKVLPTVTREKQERKWGQDDRYGTRVFEVNGVWYVVRNYYYGDDIEGEEIFTDAWVDSSFVKWRHSYDHYRYHYNRHATKFSKSDLEARGIKAYRPVSRITTECGAVFFVEH